MPRFTPWYSTPPVEPLQSNIVLQQVLRPSLQRAFPLPKPEQGNEQHLRVLLDALKDVEAEEP